MARIFSVITELNCFWVRSEGLSYTDYPPRGNLNLCHNCCQTHGLNLSVSEGQFLTVNPTNRHTHTKLSGFSPYVGYQPCMQYSPTQRFTTAHTCLSLDCTSLLCVKGEQSREKSLRKPVQLLSCENVRDFDNVNLLSYEDFEQINMVGPKKKNNLKGKNLKRKQDDVMLKEFFIESNMLQEIISGDGYIDPEILAELDEEQKQILFCKMREEQIRRYYKREKEDSKKDKKEKNNNKKKLGKTKRVVFLVGADKKDWVWVMGEHKDDKTIEQIIEEEAIAKANKEAENEATKLRLKEEEELARIRIEEEKLEKEKQENEEQLRKQAEAEYQSAKEAREAQKRLEEEKRYKEEQQRKKIEELKQKVLMEQSSVTLRKKETRRSSMKQIEGLKTKRSSEIYLSIQEVRLKVEQEAKKSQHELEKEWKKQEEKAKRLESQMRQVARKARQEWRKSITAENNDLAKVAMAILNKKRSTCEAVLESESVTTSKISPKVPPRKPKSSDRSSKPSSRAAIVQWYKEKERPKGAGYEPKTNNIATWFHGPISREAAEEVLEEKPPGSFLVRVSERIFGYAISYRAEERCKHYLINALDGKYEFFGTHQISHITLYDLVNFHKQKPISNTGQEILSLPCGQTKEPPDYTELFDQGEVTKL